MPQLPGDLLSTENGLPTTGHMAPDWAMELAAGIAFVFSIIGFLGNMLTILALPFTRKLRNAATWFVLNLAATEMLFCVTILPMSAAHLLHLTYTGDKLLDDQGCRFFVFLRYIIVQAEFLSIGAIAVNRCILIAFPKKYPQIFNCRKTAFIIFSIWIYSTVIMVFPLTGSFGSFAYNNNSQECDFEESAKTARKVYLMIGYLLPCVLIVVSYLYIFFKARESAKKMRARCMHNGNNSDLTQPATGLRNRDMRIARTIGVIFVAFILCCTPVSVAHFYDSQGRYPTLLLLLHPLYWLQYCLNIFIYVFMNKQYRDAYINYIAYWCPSFKQLLKESQEVAFDEETNTCSVSQRHTRPKKKGLLQSLSKASLKISFSNSGSSSSGDSKTHKLKHFRKYSKSCCSSSSAAKRGQRSPPARGRPDSNNEEETKNRKVSFSTPPKLTQIEGQMTMGQPSPSKGQKGFDDIVQVGY